MSSTPIVAKDFRRYPKFRHNLWVQEEGASTARLTVSHAKFDVPADEANEFLRMRSHCTGHHTVDEIAAMSGLPAERVRAVVDSLADAGVLHLDVAPMDAVDDAALRATLLAACRIWSEQLANSGFVAEVLRQPDEPERRTITRRAVLGWLLETYHYVRAFPAAVEHAAAHATGRLRDLLEEYAKQERGHERFVEDSLVRCGVRREEVQKSIPLVSTRAIDLMMRELFAFEPSAVLLVAAVIEQPSFEDEAGKLLEEHLVRLYGLPAGFLGPFLDHVRLDAGLGHARLLEDHVDLVSFADRERTHHVVNAIHDLKHAFDLQDVEIKKYYSEEGNYFPRQFVDFFAI
jgi:hypothetical protein